MYLIILYCKYLNTLNVEKCLLFANHTSADVYTTQVYSIEHVPTCIIGKYITLSLYPLSTILYCILL